MRRTAGFVVAAAVALGACSGGDTDDADTQNIIPIVPAAVGEAEVGPTPEGVIVNQRYELVLGDCFNDYEIEVEGEPDLQPLTTRVDCLRPHDAEIYASLVHPADGSVPFPGRSDIEEWATQQCYDAFPAFVGVDYELSELEIGFVVPAEDDWNLGLYRTTTCYVFTPGAELEGSMRNIAE